jgi:hypothetical protein
MMTVFVRLLHPYTAFFVDNPVPGKYNYIYGNDQDSQITVFVRLLNPAHRKYKSRH